MPTASLHRATRAGTLVLLALAGSPVVAAAQSGSRGGDEPYPNMPAVAPIGIRIGKYADIPDLAKGPPLPAGKAYRIEDLGKGLYMISENAHQSIFLVYDKGVVVVDAPPTYASYIQEAIRTVTDKPITHMIYSHSHRDHIGGVNAVIKGYKPVILAQEETLKLLKRDADPERPLPTVTFADKYTLKVGTQTLELSYHGDGHEPGNIFIYAPAQKVLMVVDVIFPGWMPWRRFAVAHDIPGVFEQVDAIRKLPWETIVTGHVSRTGTHADVERQWAFYQDLKAAAGKALATTPVGETLNPADAGNPWAVYDNYIDRVAAQCVNTLTPKWANQMAAFDVFIWDQCYSMEQSLRLD